jgi:hypothetical protein
MRDFRDLVHDPKCKPLEAAKKPDEVALASGSGC